MASVLGLATVESSKQGADYSRQDFPGCWRQQTKHRTEQRWQNRARESIELRHGRLDKLWVKRKL